MGIFDNLKAFVHSITTDDHYASYDSSTRVSNNLGSVYGHVDSRTQSTTNLTNGSTIGLNNNDSTYSINDNNHGGFYRPGMKSSQQDLPLQDFSSEGQPPLPSMDSLWDRIESWIEEEYPELEDSLNDGVTTADLNEFLQDLKAGSNELPQDFRHFYKRHDGQLRGGKPTGLIMGLVLLDLEGIIEEHIMWNKVAERLQNQYYQFQHQQREKLSEGSSASASSSTNGSFMANQRSIPPNSIQPNYYNRGWVTLLKDNIGNQVAMDLNPGSTGSWGQIILFGRDFDTKLVIARSLQEFVFGFVSDLEQGNFVIDSSEYREQFGYLSNDRNGDFMIGDEDEDQGELSFWDKNNREFGKQLNNNRASYIEILKRRALKKYGLSETFQTTYQPPRKAQSPKVPTSTRHEASSEPEALIKPGKSNELKHTSNSKDPIDSEILITPDNVNGKAYEEVSIKLQDEDSIEDSNIVKEEIKSEDLAEEDLKDINTATDSSNLEDDSKEDPVVIQEEESEKQEHAQEDQEEEGEGEEEQDEDANDIQKDDDTNDNSTRKPLTKNQKKKQKKKAKK